ncbi:unnamed protein product [Cylicocyclus nassatus]|uniref:Uncharacterized protein n=1 Tax=Cylicocyclus nassatus TaxID=53992 RepID=A0AA36MET9_CYLNA|nr:unnamed protein product [Cylicocyclus nassatus]
MKQLFHGNLVIDKYSYFVAAPVLHNRKGNGLNVIWTLQPKDVTKKMHETFLKDPAIQFASSTCYDGG